jgi:hypothetical protein
MADEWDREEASIAPKQESHGFDANRFDRMVEKAAAKPARVAMAVPPQLTTRPSRFHHRRVSPPSRYWRSKIFGWILLAAIIW